jgi:hypothetical protein
MNHRSRRKSVTGVSHSAYMRGGPSTHHARKSTYAKWGNDALSLCGDRFLPLRTGSFLRTHVLECKACPGGDNSLSIEVWM